jgi:ABC-type nitrate/sulfonate/bicarbonate transport system permease component
VKGVIITEMLVAAPGLGGLIINFAEAYRTDHLLAVVAVSLLLVVLAGQLFKLLEGRLTPWVQQSALRAR